MAVDGSTESNGRANVPGGLCHGSQDVLQTGASEEPVDLGRVCDWRAAGIDNAVVVLTVLVMVNCASGWVGGWVWVGVGGCVCGELL